MLAFPFQAEFAESLVSARKAAGLNQAELSKKAGFGEGQVSNYERNINEPTLDSWISLNKVLFPEASAFVMRAEYRKALQNQPVAAPQKKVDAEVKKEEQGPLLRDATVEEIVTALKERGFTTITITA